MAARSSIPASWRSSGTHRDAHHWHHRGRVGVVVGFEVITKVPPQLHTPLMSGSNAISGITVVGAIIVAGRGDGTTTAVLGFVAVTFATINVVGGFMVTDRMLEMFKKEGSAMSLEISSILYLVAASMIHHRNETPRFAGDPLAPATRSRPSACCWRSSSRCWTGRWSASR